MLYPIDTAPWQGDRELHLFLIDFEQLLGVLFWLALTCALAATAALLRGRKAAMAADG